MKSPAWHCIRWSPSPCQPKLRWLCTAPRTRGALFEARLQPIIEQSRPFLGRARGLRGCHLNLAVSQCITSAGCAKRLIVSMYPTNTLALTEQCGGESHEARKGVGERVVSLDSDDRSSKRPVKMIEVAGLNAHPRPALCSPGFDRCHSSDQKYWQLVVKCIARRSEVSPGMLRVGTLLELKTDKNLVVPELQVKDTLWNQSCERNDQIKTLFQKLAGHRTH